MTPAGEILRDEIARSGPLSFRRFMEVALYHPEHGYYRGGHDPFGASGDFFTAEQVQPVFGILIGQCVRRLAGLMGDPAGFTVVELGAGRGEMAAALADFHYVPVEAGMTDWPERFTGVVFANEFFDALPVHVAVRRGGGFREMLVGFEGGRFAWVEGGGVTGALAEYVDALAQPLGEGELVEVNLDALAWIDEIARRLERGFLFVIDYGYVAAELARFPSGTLMSYRRHMAIEDVLAEPGHRDITAHVPFTPLQERARARGLETVRLERLAQTLLRAGEADQFAAALAGGGETEVLRRRLQLKTLLFGMGETFRTLIARKQD